MQLRSCLKKKRDRTPKRCAVRFGDNITVDISPIRHTADSFFSEPDYQAAEAEDELEAREAQRQTKRARGSTDTAELIVLAPRAQPSRLPPLTALPPLTVAEPTRPAPAAPCSPLRKVEPERLLLQDLHARADASAGNTRASDPPRACDERLMEEIKGMTMPQLKNKIREVAARRRERERRAKQMRARASS